MLESDYNMRNFHWNVKEAYCELGGLVFSFSRLKSFVSPQGQWHVLYYHYFEKRK